jgi:6-pyruvoyl-tetrahydropterin synthase
MYYLTKTFEIPMAHRLSNHKGRCHLFHGHNLTLEVTIKSYVLN